MSEPKANMAVVDSLDNLQEMDEVTEETTQADAPEEATSPREEVEITPVEDAGSLEADEFFIIEVLTGVEPVRLQTSDPAQAQAMSTGLVKQGTVTVQVKEGVQTFPVKSVRTLGPYKKKEEADKEAA